MHHGIYYMLSRHARRSGRPLATMVVLPAFFLSPITTQALLIHDHHGHNTHSHTVSLGDLNDYHESSEHQHEKHDHDGQPVDPTEDDGTLILIVLDLPEALAGARTSSSGATVATGIGTALRPLTVNKLCLAEDVRPPIETPQTSAHILRAHSLVEGILLTNHALLL